MRISLPISMPALALAFFLTLTLSACGDKAVEPLKFSGQTMGTTWSAVLVSKDDAAALPIEQLQADFAQILKTVNDQMSTWQKDSELSNFNRQQTEDWFPVSAELAGVAAVAQEVSEFSGGIYDTTVGPLVNLWGFGAKSGERQVPQPADILAAMTNVGYQKLEVRTEPAALRKKVLGLSVDLSSIAKGYGVDQLAAYLDKAGVAHYMVEIGGEIHSKGKSPRGDDWRIAVEKPVALDRMVQQGLLLKGGGLATSGDYRNYFTADGRRYSHTFDPRNGEPVTHSLASVSVLAENAMLADAYATMLAAMGEVKGKAFALEQGIEAYFIWRTDAGFETFATEGFRAVLISADE